MLQALTPNRAVVFIVCGFLFYWLVALFAPPLLLREIFNSLSFGVALIIAITWGPPAWRAVWGDIRGGEWTIILAIFFTWFTVLLSRSYAIAFNWAGRPEEWAHSSLAGFFPYSYLMAGMLLLSAPGVTTDGFRRTAIWAMMAAVAIGSLLAGILIGVNISTVF